MAIVDKTKVQAPLFQIGTDGFALRTTSTSTLEIQTPTKNQEKKGNAVTDTGVLDIIDRQYQSTAVTHQLQLGQKTIALGNSDSQGITKEDFVKNWETKYSNVLLTAAQVMWLINEYASGPGPGSSTPTPSTEPSSSPSSSKPSSSKPSTSPPTTSPPQAGEFSVAPGAPAFSWFKDAVITDATEFDIIEGDLYIAAGSLITKDGIILQNVKLQGAAAAANTDTSTPVISTMDLAIPGSVERTLLDNGQVLPMPIEILTPQQRLGIDNE